MGIIFSSGKIINGVPHFVQSDFKKLTTVSKGANGIVKMGKDKSNKRVVAVKETGIMDIYSKREIDILKTLDHENIIKLFGVFWEQKYQAGLPISTGYVMEYFPLGSLHAGFLDFYIEMTYSEIHNALKVYNMELVMLWIQQIAFGLQYLHENRIIHRDVKPSNILLATRTHLKLADFGLARSISYQQSCTTGPIGTNIYMAPEVITSKDYGVPADVYSFGITIWEIIYRKHPSEHSTFGNGCTELPIDLVQMNEYSWSFVKSCCQREASERPTIKEIIDFSEKYTVLVVEAGYGNDMAIWNRKASNWITSQMKLPQRDGVRTTGTVYLDNKLYQIDDDKSLFKLDENMEWLRLTYMNERRLFIHNSCLSCNGYIWIIGGWNMEKGCLKSVERYDPKEDKWALMPDMKYGRAEAAATACNGKIYISEGRGDGPVYLKSVECFDPESGVWTELTNMPTPRLDHCLVWYRNRLVVIGGWDRKLPTTTVLELNPHEKNGQWKELPSLTFPGYPFVGAVLGREIFTIGGVRDDDRNTRRVEIFNGTKWQDGPFLTPELVFTYFRSAILISEVFADRLLCYPTRLPL